MKQKAVYEKIWKKYWNISAENEGPSIISRKRIIIKLLKKIKPKKKKILDVGCGSGYLLKEIMKQFNDNSFFGSDISDNALNIAKKRLPNVHFFHSDITLKNQLPKEKYDIVILEEVLEHLKNDLVALENISSILNNKGYLVVSVPYGKKNWGKPDEVFRHFRRYENKDLRKILKRVGFNKITIFDWGFPFFSLYYDLLIKKSDPKKITKIKGRKKRFASLVLSNLFKIDDKFINTGKGKRLFSISQKLARK